VGLIAAVVGVFTYVGFKPFSGQSKSDSFGRIDTPQDRTSVPVETTARGVATGIPRGHQVWLLLKVPERLRDYPASPDPLALGPDGEWSDTLTIGDPKKDIGKNYVLQLVEVGPRALRQLEEYGDTEKRTGRSPGIQEGDLASDVNPLAVVSVTRG
jgi:hypothetical protein